MQDEDGQALAIKESIRLLLDFWIVGWYSLFGADDGHGY